MDIGKLENVRKSIKAIDSALVRAYNKLTEEFLTEYWSMFVLWCIEQGLATMVKAPDNSEWVKWIGRDTVTNKLPKGTDLRWFRFLFPSIPEDRAAYRENSLYRTLTQTIHKRAAKEIGLIEEHRQAKVPDEKTASDKPSETAQAASEVAQSVNELEFLMGHSITQALFETIASVAIVDTTVATRLLDYARSHQVPKSYLGVMEQKLSEYIKRAANIKAAKAEKSA